MSATSKIEWTDATWNPVIGCTKVSPGCDHCYAIRTAHRMAENPHPAIAAAYGGTESGGEWTGRVNLLGDRLDQPLRWTKPKRIFVNAQSDLFHDNVPDEFIAEVFAVMAVTPRHTFQVLTKRHGRMRSLLSSIAFGSSVRSRINDILDNGAQWPPEWEPEGHDLAWPLPNVWLGVSVENQRWADIRVRELLGTPAAVRFLSCEPLLGPVDLARAIEPNFAVSGWKDLSGLDWVIVGGESGPGARPMQPEWARSLRDQCTAAGVAFHFKQWGEWAPDAAYDDRGQLVDAQSNESMTRVGKKAAGRDLDGHTWDEYPPAVTHV